MGFCLSWNFGMYIKRLDCYVNHCAQDFCFKVSILPRFCYNIGLRTLIGLGFGNIKCWVKQLSFLIAKFVGSIFFSCMDFGYIMLVSLMVEFPLIGVGSWVIMCWIVCLIFTYLSLCSFYDLMQAVVAMWHDATPRPWKDHKYEGYI